MDMAEWRMKGTILLVSELSPISHQILHPHSSTPHLSREAIPDWRLLPVECLTRDDEHLCCIGWPYPFLGSPQALVSLCLQQSIYLLVEAKHCMERRRDMEELGRREESSSMIPMWALLEMRSLFSQSFSPGPFCSFFSTSEKRSVKLTTTPLPGGGWGVRRDVDQLARLPHQ